MLNRNDLTPVPYIVFRHFRGQTLPDEEGKTYYVNLKYGDALVCVLGNLVSLADRTGKIICYQDSQNQYEYFAYNGDGNGLERGALTYAIAYAPHDNGTVFRFTQEEQDRLRLKWNHLLMEYEDAILFNEDFYKAPIEMLQTLAKELSIKKRGGKYRYVRNS